MVDQNINKDMNDSALIDMESMCFSDDQTWLYKTPEDSGQMLDILDWTLSLDDPLTDEDEYQKQQEEFFSLLDSIQKSQVVSLSDRTKFDSRTFVKPKKRIQRPSIQTIVETPSPNASLQSANKYLTYNKYNTPGPILRLKTFNVDTNTENSNAVKEYAMKRRSLVVDDVAQLEDIDMTLVSETSDRLSEPGHLPSKPINIDLSQPVHNLHNTFNRGIPSTIAERPSLNMYQSGESLMRMSPPSLVSSLLMDNSGNFNPESLESKKSISSYRDSGVPTTGRESIDPMMTSMTLSILDEKDMNTSFLSQTTYPDSGSLMDSLPPSLVSSVNSSYIISTSSKPKDSVDSNIFSSATFTHLEQSEKLLSARPRYQPYTGFTKRDSVVKNSESYTKSREEASQIETVRVLNENSDSPSKVTAKSNEMGETMTIHYANNKFRKNEEKENLNATFEKDDAFYRDMGMTKTVDLGRNSANVVLDKQELNEIIQARQKLSLARKALPNEPEKHLPNQVDTIQLPNQIITVPRQSMENASELLSRRRAMNSNLNTNDREELVRETPKRNATFKKPSPRTNSLDSTVVYAKDQNEIIDINSATLNLIDSNEKTLQQVDWSSQERAMVGSNESTDTGTFSSSSPPESVPEAVHDSGPQIASTPLFSQKKSIRREMIDLHNTISPIYDTIDVKSYTLTKANSDITTESKRSIDLHNTTTTINSGTIVKKSAKRDILNKISMDKRTTGDNQVKSPPRRMSPPSTVPYGSMAPPPTIPRKTNLPTSKLRQYSSHKELSRIPANPSTSGRVQAAGAGRTMVRRSVYASNPALYPNVARDAFPLAVDQSEKSKMNAPPALVRQGTETLRRERPLSQLAAPKDLRVATGSGVPVSMRSQHLPPPATSRPYSIAGANQLRATRPASGPLQRPAPVQTSTESRPVSGASALPRPSRLPGPRRTLRPPSVYSVAPTTDMDHY